MWRVCVERPLPSGSCGTAIGRLFVPIISHESNLYPQLIQDTNTKPTKKRSPKSRVWLFAFQPVNVPPSLLAPPSTNVIPDYFSIPTPPSNFTPSHIQVDDQEVEIEQQPQQQPQQQQQQQLRQMKRIRKSNVVTATKTKDASGVVVLKCQCGEIFTKHGTLGAHRKWHCPIKD
eukprot:c13090_g3_i1.p1 GENE.c13090_g3_i1~~c13090_g3_i1.p1  ORF type:complete len:174 (+),score=51.45 c13090_g3_i1:44-565(+)